MILFIFLGGYYTSNSPLKGERVDILQRLQREAAEIPGILDYIILYTMNKCKRTIKYL